MNEEQPTEDTARTRSFADSRESFDVDSELDAAQPDQIDEFTIREVLGQGGFGTVYAAFDNVLHREVAIKVPHRKLIRRADVAEMYLREARAIAALDHPHIIPVYRASQTTRVDFYIVTKLIRGCHLSQWLKRNAPTFEEIISVLAGVAEALAYAHRAGVVHRDVKPGNILITHDQHPYVADFGLALRDMEPADGPGYIGTPAFMSPEQARGEGHRVDGRSDIFSLGAVMYLMLTGECPFRAGNRTELYEQILYTDPPAPHELNPAVPHPLSRICLRALSKRAANRYQSADGFSQELRAVDLAGSLRGVSVVQDQQAHHNQATPIPTEITETSARPPVIPKGLRAFDMRDADFYLRLLPGPYDRNGTPEIVRFWLTRTALGSAEASPPIGLIYGPSGCGKTSLVRAGIMPRMPSDVKVVYVQATADRTEHDLYDRLASLLPWAEAGEMPLEADRTDSDLVETNAYPLAPQKERSRQHSGRGLPEDAHTAGVQRQQRGKLVAAISRLRLSRRQRVVIFIDQFEQWLFSHPDHDREELTDALRQCDGQYVQCILMVRDDFWMGVTRLMQSLDLAISENTNATSVDLFEMAHARAVLAEFGAAFGKLPSSQALLSLGQQRFLDEAVEYLASGGRIICVQLALLADLLKGKPWERGTGLLKDGGVSIGMHFLNVTFDAEKTSRRMHLHADGAQRVLRALLPEPGSRIKGAVRTEQELFERSGYRDRSLFRELLQILDRELHLITPTDLSDEESLSGDSAISEVRPTGYQLTHDFLIAPIRQWIEYRSRATKEGKARLRLEEFTELYRARPRPQSLPTLSEYLSICRHAPRQLRNDSQQVMLQAAFRRHFRHASIWLLVVLLLLTTGSWLYRIVDQRGRAATERTALASLLGAKLPEAIQFADQLKESDFIHDRVEEIVQDEQASLSQRVRAALVVADDNRTAQAVLMDFALQANAADVVALAQDFDFPFVQTRDALLSEWNSLQVLPERAIRAACMLANDVPGSKALLENDGLDRLAQLLIAEDPVWMAAWAEGFTPLDEQLLPKVESYLRTSDRQEDALGAVHLLGAFRKGQVEPLSNALTSLRPRELLAVVQALEPQREQALAVIKRELKQLGEAPGTGKLRREPWGSPWWSSGERHPLNELPPVDLDALRAKLSPFEAVVAEQALVIHQLPLGQLPTVAEQIEPYGFRIAELAAFTIEGESLVMVLALTDQATARWLIEADAETLRSVNEAHRQDGYLPTSVSWGEGKYTAVWIRPPQGAGLIDADMYIEVPVDNHQTDGWGRLGERGLSLPRSNLWVRKETQVDTFTSVRWRVSQDLGYSDSWTFGAADYHASQAMNRSMTTVQARWAVDLEAEKLAESQQVSGQAKEAAKAYTAIWWDGLPVDSKESGYLARREHFRLCAQWLADGFYPVAIDVAYPLADQTPLFQSVWWRPLEDVAARESIANQRANLAFAAHLLGDSGPLRQALTGDFDESTRGAVISGCSAVMLPTAWLGEAVQNQDHPMALRRASAQALSLYPKSHVSESVASSMSALVDEVYDQSSDSGLRSALERLVEAWGLQMPARTPGGSSREIESILGDRLVVIPKPGVVWVGSPANEPGRDPVKERQTAFRIDHSYAISTREVTLEQYRKWQPGYHYADQYTPTTDCPVIGLNWFQAARYCRWLSEQEGVPESEMCYPPIDQIQEGMVLDATFLKRTGYRLPTAVEWEFACRGGARSGRWFGFAPQRLNDHAWTARNSDYRLWPVASLLPNDYGLFDMLGNGMEWCHAEQHNYPQLAAGPEGDWGEECLRIGGDLRMETRGGAMLYQPLDARASQRNAHLAAEDRVYITLRIARTIAD